MARRFEFTLLLSALEPKLALMNAMWPRVAGVLNLGFNQMYRRPQDYAPMRKYPSRRSCRPSSPG
jgi:hypothetical protein